MQSRRHAAGAVDLEARHLPAEEGGLLDDRGEGPLQIVAPDVAVLLGGVPSEAAVPVLVKRI